MKLCDNCLEPAGGLAPFPLGPDRGHQRDPYTAKLDLCLACQDLLGGHLGGEERPVDLAGFHARWQAGRYVESHEQAPPPS